MQFTNDTHSKQPQDQWQRNESLNIYKSFIVQAPAGSGKTSLLVQRFLALLANAEYPEEILAITFTRKASHEMQERILQALILARKHLSLENNKLNIDSNDYIIELTSIENELISNPQKHKTYSLAKKVLQKDQERKWQILTYPQRLRILTIDALCSSLVKNAPFLTNISANFSIVSGLDANKYYLHAINNLFQGLENSTCFFHNDIFNLLNYLDNDIEQCERLLLNILQKRDQWLHYVVIAKHESNEELRSFLEHNMAQLVIDNLILCQKNVPQIWHTQLIFYMNFTYEILNDNNSTLTQNHDQNYDFNDLFTANINVNNLHKYLQQWKYLANMLLTKEHTWRKTVTKNQGFTTSHKNEKNNFLVLLQEITNSQNSTQTLQALANIQKLPTPQYSEKQFDFLKNLINILPILVAELNILFQKNNVYDYVAIALNAEKVFGENEQPSDIALYLDYKLHHILVDEFQDISQSQYRLLQKLTVGWNNDDGKTIFCVGDPMQSIYRFRQAEVGLFLHTIQHGIGNIKLELLRLTNNFRSNPEIIDWFNEVFKHIFPQYNNINNGEIAFTESTYLINSTQQNTQEKPSDIPAINIKILHKNEQCLNSSIDNINNIDNPNITATLTTIKQIHANYPEDKITILVRAKNHLNNLLPALKQENIPFDAIELESLNSNIILQDLLSLTLALNDLNNRIAWLSILRNPWCGMSLHDLYIITNSNPNAEENTLVTNKNLNVNVNLQTEEIATTQTNLTAILTTKLSIWFLIQQKHIQQQLSTQTQQSLTKFIEVIDFALKNRGRYDFIKWIELTWFMLNAPATIQEPKLLESTEQFWQILKTVLTSPTTIDEDLLQQKLQQTYTSQINHNSYVQIMTIHKAKGLESDHLILFGLENTTTSDDKDILMWLEYLNSNNKQATHNNGINYETNHQANYNNFTNLILAPLETLEDNHHKFYSYLREIEKHKNYNESIRLLYVAITRAKKSLHIISQVNTQEQETNPCNKIDEISNNAINNNALTKQFTVNINSNTNNASLNSTQQLTKTSAKISVAKNSLLYLLLLYLDI